MNMGEMERRAGNLESAVSTLRHAVDLARELKDGRAEADALGNLGLSLSNNGNHEEARKTLIAARQLARRLRHKSSEALAVGGLAREEFISENFDEAAKLYRRASELETEIGDDIHLIEDLGGLTESLAALGDVEGFSKAGQRLVDVAQKLGRESVAVRSLSAGGRRFLMLALEDASVDAFGGAIMGALVSNPDDLETHVWPFLTAVLTAREVLSVDEQESFYQKILGAIEEHYDLPEEIHDFLREMLHEAKKVYSLQTDG
jgi:tetratricopeptide (TPR) repeat protein